MDSLNKTFEALIASTFFAICLAIFASSSAHAVEQKEELPISVGEWFIQGTTAMVGDKDTQAGYFFTTSGEETFYISSFNDASKHQLNNDLQEFERIVNGTKVVFIGTRLDNHNGLSFPNNKKAQEFVIKQFLTKSYVVIDSVKISAKGFNKARQKVKAQHKKTANNKI